MPHGMSAAGTPLPHSTEDLKNIPSAPVGGPPEAKTYRITSPDGTVYRITPPAGVVPTREQLINQVQEYIKQGGKGEPAQFTTTPAPRPVEGPSEPQEATFKQFKQDMLRAGQKEADIVQVWDRLRRGGPAQADIVPGGQPIQGPQVRTTTDPGLFGTAPAEERESVIRAPGFWESYVGRTMSRAGLTPASRWWQRGLGVIAAPYAAVGEGVETGLEALGKKRPDPWKGTDVLMSPGHLTELAMATGPGLMRGPKSMIPPKPKVKMPLEQAKTGIPGPAKPAAPEAPITPTPQQMQLPGVPDTPIPKLSKDTVGDVVPIHSPDTPRGVSWLRQRLSKVGRVLPQDYNVWREVPDSPVITLTETAQHSRTQVMKDLLANKAWYKHQNPERWMEWEQKAADLMRAGQPFENAVKIFPEDAQVLIRQLKAQWAEENRAAKYFRGKGIKEEEFYILPHVGDAEGKEIIKLARRYSGVNEDLRTSLGVFEKPRAHTTMLEGMKKGADYIDPRTALAYRLWAGQKMILTHRMIEGMEISGVLHRTQKAAKSAAAKAGTTATRVTGIPGEAEWWARSAAEGKFIVDQLKDPHRFGSMARFVGLGNSIFRNIQLWNPLPHFTKNMVYKYGLNYGSMTKLGPDMAEYFRGGNPAMQQLFHKYMPFETSGRTAQELYHNLLSTIAGKEDVAFKNIHRLAWKAANWPNRMSSKVIFGALDPAIKYARFKQYVRSGVSPQNAANQVHLDLIRYGMRSDAVDTWKSIALNFFVPWRVGTTMSLYKAMRNNPGKAILWIGIIDGLREMMYRNTGWWLHLPIDYVEGPIFKLLENHDAKTVGALATSTAMMGPGGEHGMKFISSLLKAAATGEIEPQELARAFWGFAAFIDPYGATYEARKLKETGDLSHLSRLAQMFMLAAHDATNYKPARLGALVPESVLPKSYRVQQAESIQEGRKLRHEINEMRKEMRPRPKVRELVGD